MGILIKIRKKDKKFKLWSTIVDEYYFGKDWLSREEVLDFLQSRILRDAKAKCKELENSFPNGYFDKDTRRRYWFTNPKELKDTPITIN